MNRPHRTVPHQPQQLCGTPLHRPDGSVLQQHPLPLVRSAIASYRSSRSDSQREALSPGA